MRATAIRYGFGNAMVAQVKVGCLTEIHGQSSTQITTVCALMWSAVICEQARSWKFGNVMGWHNKFLVMMKSCKQSTSPNQLMPRFASICLGAMHIQEICFGYGIAMAKLHKNGSSREALQFQTLLHPRLELSLHLRHRQNAHGETRGHVHMSGKFNPGRRAG